MNKKYSIALLAVILASGAGAVRAAAITDPALLGAGAQQVTFDAPLDGTSPTSVGFGVTLTGDPVAGYVWSPPFWSLGDNGAWSLGKTFVAVQNEAGTRGTLSFELGGKQTSGIGAFYNYYVDPNSVLPSLTVTAYGLTGALLEAHDFTFQAPNGSLDVNAGAFGGIMRASPDIARVSFTGDLVALDDLSLVAVVPEPGSLALVMAALGMAGWSLRRKYS